MKKAIANDERGDFESALKDFDQVFLNFI